ncbi:MAG: zinc-dependent alcohol dehydrogenase family protein [Pseudomarimonas sp.]
MRAQIIRSFGEPTVFESAELPDPVARSGEVVVRLAATSVNPADWKMRRKGSPFAPELPAVLGCDVAGTVVAVGEGVTHLAPGDKVFGCAGGVRGSGGSYAELIAADARLLANAPRAIPLRDAAALPLVAITAWEGIERAGVTSGNTVLVHGGTGGVGHVAIQMAKARGARVFATVSSAEKARIAKALGADETINYRDESVEAYTERLTQGRGFDVVFDATGGNDLAPSFAAARFNGQVVTIVARDEANLSPMMLKGLSLHVVFMLIPLIHDIGREAHGKIMQEVAALVDGGQLKPLIDPEEFTLDRLSDAHAKLEAGKALGKLVIDIG